MSLETQPLIMDFSFSEKQEVSSLNLTQRLDNLLFSKWHFLMLIAIGLTWIFDGYEVSMLSLASVELRESFSVKDDQITLIASFYLAGCCVGALFFGFLATNYGRKKLFNITLIIYVVSVIAISFSRSYNQILFCRFLTGIGVGGEYSAIFAAVDELVPAHLRGRIDIILDGSWHFGSLIASCLSIIFYRALEATNIWRYLFFVGAIGAFPLFYLRSKIPESPRWLINQGKTTEAELIVKYIESCVNENSWKSVWQKEIPQFKDNRNERSNHGKFNISNLCFYYVQKYPKRVFLGLSLLTSQAFFYNGIFYTFSLILNEFYNVDKNDTGYFMIPLALASFIGPICLGSYFDTWGRRIMISITYILSGLLLLLTAILFSCANLGLYSQVLLWFIVFLIASPGASAAHLTISEIFPVEIRSQSMAIFFAVGMGIGGVIAPYFFGILINGHERNNVAVGYGLGAFFMICGGIIGWIFGINAERKSLEEIRYIEIK